MKKFRTRVATEDGPVTIVQPAINLDELQRAYLTALSDPHAVLALENTSGEEGAPLVTIVPARRVLGISITEVEG